MKRVFLGGTCNESTWRSEMETLLKEAGMDYFNPVVDDWTPAHLDNELRERKECDICLYTITPKMTGVYSIAEAIDDSNKRPDKTVLVLLRNDERESFTCGQWTSLRATAKMAKENGASVYFDLKSAALAMSNKGG